MINETGKYASIDAYIATFPADVQKILQTLRAVIKTAAPDAIETIKYQMPTYVLHENLVHFAAYPHHIGFYPTPSGITAFSAELTAYATSKGTIRFPLGQPLPFDLIARMVAFRVNDAVAKAAAKKEKP